MHTTFIRPLLAGSLVLFAAATTLQAAEHTHRQHGAHKHGSAKLRLATDGSELYIELESPAINLLGFEHPPVDEQQQATLSTTIDTLKGVDQLLLLPAAAGCTVQEVEVASALLPGQHNAARAGDEGHADFHVQYHFDCAAIEALRQIDVRLFERFPATHELDVELLTDHGQQAMKLDSQHTLLAL